ncbi:amidase [Haloplanus sp. GCM10025708]|uniref:amidase n=1 Tax=Haloferacaceae TaxID=1644056 RepID=UPI0036143AFD
MASPFDPETVRAAAARLGGPTPNDEDVRAALEGDLTLLAERYEDCLTEPSRRIDVTPADDDFNAFRNRFELREESGPLDLTVGIKDNLGVDGVPMACGSRALEDAVSTRDATAVSRLLAAGATLVGKTHMDELAYGATSETNAFGPVRNPFDTSRIAGGSSSGSAAAVGAELCDVALGSDTGGSVRLPAGFCGVVGFKPTWDAISREGMIDMAASFDHVGVFGQDVSTTARTFAAVADAGASELSPDTGPEPADAEELTLGVVTEGFGDHVTDGVSEAVRSTIDDLEAAGVETRDVSIPGFTQGADIWFAITNVEMASVVAHSGLSLGRREEHDPAWRAALAAALEAGEGFGETFRRKVAIGATILSEHPEWYAAAQNERAALTREFDAALAEVDALCLPTMAETAPPIGRGAYTTEVPVAVNTRPANLAGTPGISLPAGTHEGLPVGFQLIAPRGEDDELLSVAATVAEHC